MKTTHCPMLLPMLIGLTMSLSACGGSDRNTNDGSSTETMSMVLYQLTQSEYDKIDANQLTINQGSVDKETIYRATGTGTVAPDFLQNKVSYVIADNYFATNTGNLQKSRTEQTTFYTDRIVKKLKDSQSGRRLTLSSKLNKVDLSGYKPYQANQTNSRGDKVAVATLFSDWRGTLANNSTPPSILNIQFPEGSVCYHTADLTSSQNAFITDPDKNKTVATDLEGFKLIAMRIDAQKDDLSIIGEFKDVLVGTGNKLPATYAPTQRRYQRGNQTQIVNFFDGGVLIAGNVYQAKLYEANVALASDDTPECDYYNQTATHYIIEQFTAYAK